MIIKVRVISTTGDNEVVSRIGSVLRVKVKTKKLDSEANDILKYFMADFFSVCADPTRVKIFSALATGDMCVGDLACAVGMHPSTISHQLKLLRDKGMVSVRRRGKVVYYSLSDPAVEAALDIGANRLARRA